MASQDGFRRSVSLDVSHLEGDERTRRRPEHHHHVACCGYSSSVMMAIGIGLILLGILTTVFGTLCISAGVRYGLTGDTLIKPWRALPLGGMVIVCGACGVRLTRRLRWKPRRQAVVTMLLSVVSSAWALVVILSYSFDVAEQLMTYRTLEREYEEAAASRLVMAGFRRDKMNLAMRDMAYFSGAVASSVLTALLAALQAVMAGLYATDPVDQEGPRRRHGSSSRNPITAMSRVFVNYKHKAALVTGVIQVVCGCSVVLGLGLALATEHNPAWAAYVISHGILFIASGIVGTISSRLKARPWVTASMVMAVCALVAAINMICSDISFIINSNTHPTSGRSKIDKLALTTKLFAIHGLDLFVNLIQLITAAILSGLGCHVTCDVAGKADATRCLVSYVEVGQADSERPDFNMNDADGGAFSLQLPDILHESMNYKDDDDVFTHEPAQYMTEAMALPAEGAHPSGEQ